MPKIAADECPAGPAMDAAVAEALGFEVVLHYGQPMVKLSDGLHDDPEPYSSNIAAAEKLWDKLAEGHWVVSVCYGPGRDHRNYASVQMQLDIFLAIDLLTRNPMDMDARGKTKALAICRAFLKANGVEFVEIENGR